MAKPIPIKYVPVVQPKQVKPKDKTSWEVLVMNDVVSGIRGTFSRPMVVLIMALCCAIVVAHQTNFDESAIGKWVNDNSTSKNSLAIWVKNNHEKFLGLVIFFPTIFDIPHHTRVPVAIATVAWVYLVPERTVWEYVIQSFALHTYFRVKLDTSRLVIILSVVIAWFAGWVK